MGSKLHHHQLSGQRKSSGRRGLTLRCKDAFCEVHTGGRLNLKSPAGGGPAADLYKQNKKTIIMYMEDFYNGERNKTFYSLAARR